MTIPVRVLLDTQIPLPLDIIPTIVDKAVKKFLEIFHHVFDETLSKISSVINDKMTNRFGDTFYGMMKFGAGGYITIPVLTADPTGINLVNGSIWYRSDLGTFRCYQNGAVKTFTTA